MKKKMIMAAAALSIFAFTGCSSNDGDKVANHLGGAMDGYGTYSDYAQSPYYNDGQDVIDPYGAGAYGYDAATAPGVNGVDDGYGLYGYNGTPYGYNGGSFWNGVSGDGVMGSGLMDGMTGNGAGYNTLYNNNPNAGTSPMPYTAGASDTTAANS